LWVNNPQTNDMAFRSSASIGSFNRNLIDSWYDWHEGSEVGDCWYVANGGTNFKRGDMGQ
jgi:hypothetical protein